MTMSWPLAKAFPFGTRGTVAAKHPLAAAVGVAILRRGGTAIDAAVATSLAIGVVEPYLSGIGGGGLAIYAPVGGEPFALHFGMRAATSARPDMYRIEPGASTSDLPWWPPTEGDEHMAGPTSVAVPCQVQGLYQLWQIGGRLPWDELVAPAITLAKDGFAADWLTSIRILEGHDLIARSAETRSIFMPRGRPPLPETTS